MVEGDWVKVIGVWEELVCCWRIFRENVFISNEFLRDKKSGGWENVILLIDL